MNELVIARYNENIDWIPTDIDWKLTVYNKQAGTNLLPNVGRESHSYFHHIVHNYNALADWTIFAQAAPAEHPGHNGDTAMATIINLLRMRDFPFTSGYIPLVQSCLPISSHTGQLEVINVAKEIGIQPSDVKQYFFPNGIFAVSKDVILNHSKDFYEKCLNLLTASDNPPNGHYFERLWPTIFAAIPVSKTNDLKILSAKFGQDPTWVDVTEQVQYMCSLENGMCTKNVGWGVIDPIPYVVKTTVIEYSCGGNIVRVDAKDNDIVTINEIKNRSNKPISIQMSIEATLT